MRSFSAFAMAIAALASLGCGPMFCVDTSRCWDRVARDTFDRFDTGDVVVDEPDELAVVAIRQSCEADTWVFHAEIAGAAAEAVLDLGRPGELVEEHPGVAAQAADGVTTADWKLAVGEYAPGEATSWPCAAEPDLAYLLRARGDGETCVVWGPGAEELDPGCERWF